jgi:RimJ/RimL family protein N-acetyltransferase
MTAYRVKTERLVLRCFSPEDAVGLKQAIDANLEHLRRWLPWANNEPETLDAKIERLRHLRASFDLDNDFTYGIFSSDESVVVGGIGSHPRVGPSAREIGYWLRKDHTGRGLATEAVAALVRVGFEVDRLERLEIHCDPENVRSAAIARKLGFTLDATLRRRELTHDGRERDQMIWSLFAGEFATSPASRARIDARDAAGRRVL